MSCTHWWQKIKSDVHIPPKKGTRIIMFNPINNRFRETIQTYHQTYQSLHENKSKKNFPWKLNSLFFSFFPPLNQFWQNRKSLSPSWHLSQGDALPTSGGNRNRSQKGVPFWPFWHFWLSLLAENNIGARLIWGEWNCMNIRFGRSSTWSNFAMHYNDQQSDSGVPYFEPMPYRKMLTVSINDKWVEPLMILNASMMSTSMRS